VPQTLAQGTFGSYETPAQGVVGSLDTLEQAAPDEQSISQLLQPTYILAIYLF
jgi:hypothetical protein